MSAGASSKQKKGNSPPGRKRNPTVDLVREVFNGLNKAKGPLIFISAALLVFAIAMLVLALKA
jgi:hypothetical protein